MHFLYLLWPDKIFTAQQRREILLNNCAPEILKKNVLHLRMNIDDEFSTVKSPAPKWYKGAALVATVSVDCSDDREKLPIKTLLENAGFSVGCYQVEQSIYKDYGDNQHFHKRDWPDGQRSPSVQMVTLLTRPKKLSPQEWIKRWHGNMSPVSEQLQPRARYVRNVILDKTEDSPAFDGAVEEAWPSAQHISNPFLFYCAENPLQLAKNMARLMKAVTHFHQLHKIRTVTMSEYFIKS